MKPILKLSGTLIFNQFLADIACCMCIIPFSVMFGKDAMFTYILFLILDVFFFYYISYHAAYKVGFHDVSRHSSEAYDKGYLVRGLSACLIAASPSIILMLLWLLSRLLDSAVLGTTLYISTMWNLFGSWPLRQIIPNHLLTVQLICIAMQILFPLIGYISGYKGIVYFQRIREVLFEGKKHK